MITFELTLEQLRKMRRDILSTPGANGVLVEIQYVDAEGEVKTTGQKFTLQTVETFLARLESVDRAMRN